MSGNLTPVGAVDELRDPAAGPMPGFHHRKEVQRMLARWRRSVAVWGLVLSRAEAQRDGRPADLRLPQHTLQIK